MEDIKEKILKSIKEMPDKIQIEDAIERLYLLYKIEKGIKQADNGENISDEEAKKKLQKWLS